MFLLRVSLFCLAGAMAGPAIASPCGDRATQMLREFLDTKNVDVRALPTEAQPTPGPGVPSGPPLTARQQEQVRDLLTQAAAADNSGDQDACGNDINRAEAIIRG